MGDWGGFNDRHALVPRGLGVLESSSLFSPSRIYFDAWSWLTEGTAYATIADAFWDANICLEEEVSDPQEALAPCINVESWLWIRTITAGTSVSRYPNVAWISCVNMSSTQH